MCIVFKLIDVIYAHLILHMRIMEFAKLAHKRITIIKPQKNAKNASKELTMIQKKKNA